MRKIPVLLAMLSLIAAALASPVAAVAPDQPTGKAQVYLVNMLELPVAAYKGGVAGIPATKPANGKKINPDAANVQRYVAHLTASHDSALKSVGASQKLYDYVYARNGFAAKLTPAQAAKLLRTKGVLMVVPDQMRTIQTDHSPEFLGLTAHNGLWEQDGGQGAAGENVIVGVIDTGIWPEHPSFSDRTGSGPNGKAGKLAYQRIPGWHGKCQVGQDWNASDCNNKLIGARYFNAGYIASAGGLPAGEVNSARDVEGHGTHTSSTAAGNAGVHAVIFGRELGIVSGIAPRARVAMYKALWGGSGTTSDLAAAIDAAVADGVDVINYSIGSDTPALAGADELSFLFANDAGVFASVSAGNAGPGADTVGSPASAPWVTAVGASTQDRTFQGSVVLGNGEEYFGASVTNGTNGSFPIVDSVDVPADGADSADAELCMPDSLDASKVAGKIVLCRRGVNARVEKSEVVADAGGVGMVLYNASNAQELVTDNHFVPSVHINFTGGSAVKQYIHGTNAPTAEITAGEVADAQGDVMAAFSSRGADGAAEDLVKPDVSAPGVNILAGMTPEPRTGEGGLPGQLFQSISGTSMAAPHVAGVAALLRQLHPTWTPDMIKSALVTTGTQDVTKEDGSTPADPFDFGGGRILPNSAADPGLTYTDPGFNGYLAFLCGAEPGVVNPASCTALEGAGFSTDPSELNLPSIGIAEVVGTQTVHRSVTSVTAGGSNWTATVSVPGFDATTPEPFTLAEGASHEFAITFARTDAEIDTWSFGWLTLTDNRGHVAKSPIALRAEPIDAPGEQTASATADSGSLTWDVKSGYDGTLSADGFGLAADNAETVRVNPDSDSDISTGTFTDGVVTNDFTLTGAHYYAGGIQEDANVVGDLDVFLFYDADDDGFTLSDLIAQAADGDSNEVAELVNPPDGKYRLVIHGWGAPPGGVDVTRHQWTVGDTAADSGSLSAIAGGGDPATVTTNEVVTITANYTGVTAGEYRGVVSYNNGTDEIGTTVVKITRAATP
jgi:subtilisin family serine protease